MAIDSRTLVRTGPNLDFFKRVAHRFRIEFRRLFVWRLQRREIEKYLGFSQTESGLDAASSAIPRSAYQQYVTEYSAPNAAISYELALFLWEYCRLKKVKTILEFGSGFSTYVFARYCAEFGNSPKLVSVETSGEWRQVTEDWLTSNNLQIKVRDYTEYDRMENDSADIVFLDVGVNIQFRAEVFGNIVSAMRDDTVIIVDDWHKPALKNLCRAYVGPQHREVSLECVTFDVYERYAAAFLMK